jgi:LuxR family transcriptional regulator, quorum-sensing system regulator CciR
MSLRSIEAGVTSIDDAQTLGDLHKAMTGVNKAIGFQYFALIQANSGRADSGVLLQDYPDRWISLQSESFGYTRSPILQAASRTATPFEWRDLPALMVLTKDQLAYLELAADYGLGNGFTVPIHAPGESSALVSFVNEWRGEIDKESFPLAMYVAARVFASASRIKRASIEHKPGLSDADAKVITMVCRGRSKNHIAEKLGVGIRDVNDAVGRGCKHYRVGSQTEMIVHALFERSIRFEDIIR